MLVLVQLIWSNIEHLLCTQPIVGVGGGERALINELIKLISALKVIGQMQS